MSRQQQNLHSKTAFLRNSIINTSLEGAPEFKPSVFQPNDATRKETINGGVINGSSNDGTHDYMMSGVKVKFPFKAYPSQEQMMAKIIEALHHSQNAILESPTGSGKSLALLCAALAWRENEKERIIRECEKAQAKKKAKHREAIDRQNDNQKGKTESSSSRNKNTNEDEDELEDPMFGSDEDDFQKPLRIKARARVVKRRKPDMEEKDFSSADFKRRKNDNKYEKLQMYNQEDLDEEEIEEKPALGKVKIPKIYFGSRTHKQISQVIKELKENTTYRPKMAILGSRDHMCVHPEVSKSYNKNEECASLLDNDACIYYHNVKALRSHKKLWRSGEHAIWDIEDLNKLGKKVRGCPYFTARTLADQAEIIFCPYNYLIDPIIRESLAINLKDNILILDEAHNIEDAARDAGSFEVNELEIRDIEKELNDCIASGVGRLIGEYRTLKHVVGALLNFIVDGSNTFELKEHDRHINLWSGTQLLAKLDALGINPMTFKTAILPASEKMCVAEEEQKKLSSVDNSEQSRSTITYEENRVDNPMAKMTNFSGKSLSGRGLRILERLFVILKFLFKEEFNYADDYKMALIKNVQRASTKNEWTFKLGFWCLNPGVAFHSMSASARCIILTSGTLSPMNSFASELQADFPIRLEANHVISNNQVWSGVIPIGPGGTEFNGIFSRVESFSYQDDMGEALLALIGVVPHGVLCFMPSYNAMDKFLSRWKNTGLYNKLAQKKIIICESRNACKSDFEKELNLFYKSIESSKKRKAGGKSGALLFAVFRGKVSEGIDFTDDNCRAVISIGIPYPFIKDIQINLKKEYNDAKSKKIRGFLNGNQWYNIQAYRAINQALGRCIRHREDWGAIILLEQRFLNQSNISGLSKWIRGITKKHDKFDMALASVNEFVTMRTRV